MYRDRVRSFFGVVVVVATAACGKSDVRIVKTSIVDRPRMSQGEMQPQAVLLVDLECAAGSKFEGKLLPVSTVGYKTAAFEGTTDDKGHGQGALELTGHTFAKATHVEVRCGGASTSAPVSLPLAALQDPMRVLCWGAECEVKVTRSRSFSVLEGTGADLEGFTFAGQAAVADGSSKILRVEPPGGTAKLRLDQLNTSVKMSGVLAIKAHGKVIEVPIPDPSTTYSVSTEPLALAYVEKLAADLASALASTTAPVKRASALLHLGFRLYPLGDVATPLGAVEVLAVAKEIRTGDKIRTINCGTYRGADGASGTYVVYLIDSDVTVYDLPTKTIIGTKKFRGSGSCPSSFLGDNGEQGQSGGYANPDQLEAYVSTFVK